MQLVADAARHLRAAPRLVTLATRIKAGVRAHSTVSSYNGLHLRMEADSSYVGGMGGVEVRP
jgi:hypothetical protein